MLEAVGAASLDELIDQAVPASIRTSLPTRPHVAMTEAEVAAHLRELAGRNRVLTSMIGLGYHGTHTPAVIRRNVLENPAWYTAYTPYQPEISQGRLEAALVFQTMVEDLTGLPVAGASLLDEATAVTEAALLMRRAVRGKDGGVVVVDARVLPQSLAVLRGRADAIGLPLVVGGPDGRAAGAARGGRAGGRRGPAARRGRSGPGRRADRRGRARRGRPGHGGRRPALAHAAHPARRARRRRRGRVRAAVRGADVLRRPARRVHGGALRARASAAGPAGRGERGRRRRARLPAEPADP